MSNQELIREVREFLRPFLFPEDLAWFVQLTIEIVNDIIVDQRTLGNTVTARQAYEIMCSRTEGASIFDEAFDD